MISRCDQDADARVAPRGDSFLEAFDQAALATIFAVGALLGHAHPNPHPLGLW
jgi:hypothetical protein